jgi:ABC-type branched-subunit amino acid transport system substrate-binding protein
MPRPQTLFLLAVLGVLVCSSGAVLSRASAQAALTPSESRGKQIYLQGTSQSGRQILAYVGEAALEMPGATMACANCHGLDGRGKPEGSISPSDITPESLTKPYGVIHADGRKHPAYTERAFEAAITRGIDPAGNRLSNVMPRYSIARDDLSDLIAYVARLDRDRDPGISETSIVIGAVLPEKGPLGEMGQAIRAATTAFFDDLNKSGGIFNRKIELRFADSGETPAAARANIERLLQTQEVFAMTVSLIAGAEKEITPLMAQMRVPMVGALTLYPQTDYPLNREVFYLISGMDGQARAMIHHAASNPELRKTEIAIVYPDPPANVSVVAAAKDQCEKDRLKSELYRYPAEHFDGAALSKKIGTAHAIVLFLGDGRDAVAFMRAADESGWHPTIYIPSPNSNGDLFHAPVGFDRKILLSFPTSPADQTTEAIKEFRAFAANHKLPSNHTAALVSAYGGLKILTEALKRAGKDISREKLIDILEGFYDYPTGLTPPITYGPNARVGAMGAYIVAIDLQQQQFISVSGWVKVN